MIKRLIILFTAMFIMLTSTGQNLFFFGENSYPCTKAITLHSNSGSNDLKIIFARDGTFAFIVVSIKPMSEVLIKGKLIIYLNDGSVITCNDTGKNDYVDRIASSVYYLNEEQLIELKASNINTVRYSLKTGDYSYSPEEGNYSASNKGTSTKTIVSVFYEGAIIESYVERSESNQDVVTGSVDSMVYGEGSGTGTEGISYDLAGRMARSLPKPKYDVQSEGIVVVEVTVDRNGNVTKATAGVKGSTTLEDYLLRVAREAALATKFDSKPDASFIQKGTITYHFIIR